MHSAAVTLRNACGTTLPSYVCVRLRVACPQAVWMQLSQEAGKPLLPVGVVLLLLSHSVRFPMRPSGISPRGCAYWGFCHWHGTASISRLAAGVAARWDGWQASELCIQDALLHCVSGTRGYDRVVIELNPACAFALLCWVRYRQNPSASSLSVGTRAFCYVWMCVVRMNNESGRLWGPLIDDLIDS